MTLLKVKAETVQTKTPLLKLAKMVRWVSSKSCKAWDFMQCLWLEFHYKTMVRKFKNFEKVACSVTSRDICGAVTEVTYWSKRENLVESHEWRKRKWSWEKRNRVVCGLMWRKKKRRKEEQVNVKMWFYKAKMNIIQ